MKLDDLKELLIMEANNHLFALNNSESYNGFEVPSVYITEGVLSGICKVTDISYEVKKRWKITFYKASGKEWFSHVFSDMTEEDADKAMSYRLRRQREESAMRDRVFGG